MATIYNPGDDALAVAGFADTSTGQEWFEQGLKLYREMGNYEQARLGSGPKVRENPWKNLVSSHVLLIFRCITAPKVQFEDLRLRGRRSWPLRTPRRVATCRCLSPF